MLGGSFDPIHNGHLQLADAVLREEVADEVWLLPSWEPPHKRDTITSAEHRVAMCRMAVQGIPRLKVDTIEVDRKFSYTADTLCCLHADFETVHWSLVVGEDILRSLPYWKNSNSVLRLADLIICHRPGQNITGMFDDCVQYLQRAGGRITVLETVPDTISSSQLRTQAAAGKSLSEFVPEAVDYYIAKTGLYSKE